MRSALLLLTCVTLLVASSPTRACGPDPTALSLAALSEDPKVAEPAIRRLRQMGPKGLEALVSTYQSAIDRHRANPTQAEPMWSRLSAALDAVAAQKDAWAANLYWYTDLDAAKRAATAANKPILSLRLLGTLDTELSCANSRFFRTALYPNAKVGAYLRENFVLHWQSHRPVPKLTIDFGDGRTIERTITGNSAHYVLTPDGRPVDVIPGLYNATKFVEVLEAARTGLAYLAAPDGRGDPLTVHHRERLAELDARWADNVRRVSPAQPLESLVTKPRNGGDAGNPTAMAAARIAVAKSAGEFRPVAAATGERIPTAATADDELWARVAALHLDDSRLDAGSRAVVAAKTGRAVAANNLTKAKRRVEDPATRLVANFERSLAEDTVRNEYTLHRRVHEWFSNGTAPAGLDELNERVYAELFLMPKGDPWLGLVPEGAYTALPADAATAKR